MPIGAPRATKATARAGVIAGASAPATPCLATPTVERVPPAGAKPTDQEGADASDTYDALAPTLGHGLAPFAANVATATVPAFHVAAPSNAAVPRASRPRPASKQVMHAPALVDVPGVLTVIGGAGHPPLNATPARPIGPVGHAVLAEGPGAPPAPIVTTLRP